MRILTLIAACSLLAGSMSGCQLMLGFATLHENDVSDRSDVWGGYEQGEIYTTLLDSFIVVANNWDKKRMLVPALSPDGKRHGMMYWSAPESVSAYESNPDEWERVRGVVPAGTQVEITSIRAHGSRVFGRSVMAFGVILNREHESAFVGLGDMSTFFRRDGESLKSDLGGFLKAPDPHLLELVKPANQE